MADDVIALSSLFAREFVIEPIHFKLSIAKSHSTAVMSGVAGSIFAAVGLVVLPIQLSNPLCNVV
ncbi:hypothetical protein KU456_23860, partial [Salmonella enterica subsp. enterica serovar Mbandaka]|nr:hypothetical protein [Salmonella enterica subsp. enterica serovar Mbandaka]